ncbi:putative phosphate transport regulator [Burkholderia multivorans]
MFGRFMPTEGKFFEIFNAHAKYIVAGGRELELLIDNLADAEIHKQNVQSAEKAADKLTHEAIDLLHKTFITPLDRDEIHKLITTMDDILDLMEDVATSVSLYDVRAVTSEATQLAHIVTQSAQYVQQAVGLLSDMKQSSQILKACEEIDRWESEADRVLRGAMSKLFREEDDVKTLIKLKAIYELLEQITDKCEDVANIIEGIVLENA